MPTAAAIASSTSASAHHLPAPFFFSSSSEAGGSTGAATAGATWVAPAAPTAVTACVGASTEPPASTRSMSLRMSPALE